MLTFTLRITLPEWDALGQTGCLGAAREWDTVLNCATIHEHGHADRYQARYQEWADKVSGRLAAAQISACATTRSAVTAAAQQQIDAIIRGISDQLPDEIADDPEQSPPAKRRSMASGKAQSSTSTPPATVYPDLPASLTCHASLRSASPLPSLRDETFRCAQSDKPASCRRNSSPRSE